MPQTGAADAGELQGAARGEAGRLALLARHMPYRDRPGDTGHAGLGATSARAAAPLRRPRRSRPRRRAAAGGGAGRGRAAGREVSPDRRYSMHVGDAGASALAAALGRGALPRLKLLMLCNAAIGNAGLVALAPALWRRPALEELYLAGNPFGDEGLATLVAPPPPAGAPPPLTGVLAKLKTVDLGFTQITDAGCATLAAALDSGALPALEMIFLEDIPASAAAIVSSAMVTHVLRLHSRRVTHDEKVNDEESESEHEKEESEGGEEEEGEEEWEEGDEGS